MATPRSYIPSDLPIVTERYQVPIKASHDSYKALRDAVLQYGFVPPNFRVNEKKRFRKNAGQRSWNTEVQYTNLVSGKTSWVHPLNPGELRAKPKLAHEFLDDRPDIPSLYHPPIRPYQAGDLLYQRHDTWEAALAASLTESNASGGTPVTEAQVKLIARKKEKSELYQTLYHPADRSTCIFKDEPDCSNVAAYCHRSLVILAPHMPLSPTAWNRPWDRENRPPVRYRWSTGPQASDRMTFLACMPILDSDSKEVYWLSIKPSSAYKNAWDSQYHSRDMKLLLTRFNFPQSDDSATERFAWTLVAIHRRCLRGGLSKSLDLGSYIMQYGEHLQRDIANRKWTEFSYDKTKQYKGRKVSFQELGAWILTNAICRKYVLRWEALDQADIDYRMDETDAKWDLYKEGFEAARRVPV